MHQVSPAPLAHQEYLVCQGQRVRLECQECMDRKGLGEKKAEMESLELWALKVPGGQPERKEEMVFLGQLVDPEPLGHLDPQVQLARL